ncbi:MAG: hypothetical protein JSR43_06415 [Proteobacteria bacterium]|nr:hypothetical protein [Pseudomonadota bacterium]
MGVDKLLATLGLIACLLLLARMAIGPRRRRRLDARLQQTAHGLVQRARALWRQQRLHNQATRETEALIRRARQVQPRGRREGNAYRRNSFDERDEAPDGRERKDH